MLSQLFLKHLCAARKNLSESRPVNLIQYQEFFVYLGQAEIIGGIIDIICNVHYACNYKFYTYSVHLFIHIHLMKRYNNTVLRGTKISFPVLSNLSFNKNQTFSAMNRKLQNVCHILWPYHFAGHLI